MDIIRFGPSGNSDSFYAEGHKSTLEMPEWISSMGLNAFEYSFGRGVNLRAETGKKIAVEANRYGIAMSVHMPYYINISELDEKKAEDAKRYFLMSAAGARSLGADRMVFHPGPAKADAAASLANAKKLLGELIRVLDEAGYGDITLCPETMGKASQLGSIAHILELCSIDDRLIPTLDFGHIHARGLGAINWEEDYADILDAVENALGVERASRCHIHFSRIEFGKSGEKMHRTLAEEGFGPDFMPLARQLAKRGYAPRVISESRGTMAEDARALREMYLKALSEL